MYKDVPGQKYNRLTVVKFIYRKRKLNYWLFTCDCGNNKEAPICRVRDGGIKSCGCLLKEMYKNLSEIKKLPIGESSLNMIIKGYKQGAKYRDLEFDLSREYFKYLTKLNCHYCGTPPLTFKFEKNTNGGYLYNGIDRVDNSKGYIKDNCVPCCKICNFMKKELSETEFLIYIGRIYKYNQIRIEMLENNDKNIKEIKEKFKNET